MRKNILFCYSRYPAFTNAVRDYVEAFGKYSSNSIHYYDMDSGPINFELEPFDCIIFNYCFWGRCLEISKELKSLIREFNGLKIAILQDEYEYFLWHEKTLIDIKIDTIITCVPEPYWQEVYRAPEFRRVTFINALTGYVPDNLLDLPNVIPLKLRNWHVGYRSRLPPYIFGSLTYEKFLIGEKMKQICMERSIPFNIEVSEESRIYGEKWPEFIRNCRVVLGTESGSNVFDFDGTLKTKIENFLDKNPDASFNEVYDKYLKNIDGRIKMNQISPRIFEAIALHTGLVLFEGYYSGVIKPWKHYIPLKKDFSNIDEVIKIIEDDLKLGEMITRAYNDVIASSKYHYRAYIEMIDAHINNKVSSANCYIAQYGIVAWRNGMNKIQILPTQNMQIPTQKILHNYDNIPDPFFRIVVDLKALHRAFIRRYEAVLYSKKGKFIHSVLKKNDKIYKILKLSIRFISGRN